MVSQFVKRSSFVSKVITETNPGTFNVEADEAYVRVFGEGVIIIERERYRAAKEHFVSVGFPVSNLPYEFIGPELGRIPIDSHPNSYGYNSGNLYNAVNTWQLTNAGYADADSPFVGIKESITFKVDQEQPGNSIEYVILIELVNYVPAEEITV